MDKSASGLHPPHRFPDEPVDDSAHVIATNCDAGRTAVVVGWPGLAPQHPGATLDAGTLARFVADANTLRASRLDPVYLNFDRFGGLDARLRGGLALRFGDDRDLAQKASLVDPILRAYGPRTRDVAVIDLRAPATPVVEERGPHK